MNSTDSPPGVRLDYQGALRYLFAIAKTNPVAKELCQQIDLSMDPPIEVGILQYLFRLQAIGRIGDWPLLFGNGNTFIIYILDKMSKGESNASNDNENERMIWKQRQKEATEWTVEAWGHSEKIST